MYNALQFDLHNGGSPAPTVYVLKVSVGSTYYTAYVDPTTGRPDTQIQIVVASYQLVGVDAEKAGGSMELDMLTSYGSSEPCQSESLLIVPIKYVPQTAQVCLEPVQSASAGANQLG